MEAHSVHASWRWAPRGNIRRTGEGRLAIRPRRLAIATLALVAVLVGANFWLELTPLADPSLDRALTLATYLGAIGLAALVCLIRSRAGGAPGRPWAWIAAGLVAWALGEGVLALVPLSLDGSIASVASASGADVLWLAYYAAILAGVWRLTRAQGLLDLSGPGIAVGALGAATVWSSVMLRPVLFEGSPTAATALTVAAAYPVLGMALLLLLAAAVLSRNGRRLRAMWLLLGAGLAVSAIADSWWAAEIARGTHAIPHFVDSLWPLSAALLAAASLAAEPAAARRRGVENNEIRGPMALLALVVALAALVVDHFARLDPVTLGLAAAAVLAAAFKLLYLYRTRVAADAAARDAAMRSVRALAAAVDAKDHYTHDHSDRVALVVAALAIDAGLSRRRIERLVLAAHLHDVGKIAVPDSILLKPGRLTDEEYAAVKNHSAAGARMVQAAGLPDVAQWVRHHHERWDGGGYPSGLSGERIPLEARILGLADSLEAMTGTRAYGVSLTPAQAARELDRCAGSQFDPRLARRLSEMLRGGELELDEELVSFAPAGREEEAGAVFRELFEPGGVLANGDLEPITETAAP